MLSSHIGSAVLDTADIDSTVYEWRKDKVKVELSLKRLLIKEYPGGEHFWKEEMGIKIGNTIWKQVIEQFKSRLGNLLCMVCVWERYIWESACFMSCTWALAACSLNV